MKTTEKSTSNRKRRGIALIWVMLLFMVLLAIAGLLIDTARIYLTAHQLHDAADAAALAGSRYVSVYGDPNSTYPDARDKAQEYASANYANNLAVNLDSNMGNIDLDPDENGNLAGDIVIGRYIMQYATDDDPDTEPFLVMTPTELLVNGGANAMKVVARKDGIINEKLSLLFGPIFGIDDVGIRRYAIAFTYNSAGAGLIALADDPDKDPGLLIHGTPYLNVEGGSIQVNDIGFDAMTLQGQDIDINAQDINITGDYVDRGFDVGEDIVYNDITSSLNTGMPAEPDPYAALPEPAYAGLPDLSDPNNTGNPKLIKVTTGEDITLQPGYYSRGIQNNGGILRLEPGIYHVGGDLTKNNANGGFQINGGDLYADGVMFHVLDNGFVDLTGNGHIEVSPLTSGDYKGFSFFQARDNFNDAEINGNGDLDLAGILYFPENHLEVTGNGDSIGTQLVAYTIGIGGTGEVIINYKGSPLPSNKSYLVE